MSFVQDRALPIISFNTDITQISNHSLVTNQAKIETNLSKGAFDPEHFVSTKRFPPPRFKFGERIVPERTDNKRPLHILLRP